MKNNKLAKHLVMYTLVIVGLFVLLFALTQMTEDAGGQVTFEEPPTLDDQPTLGNANAEVSIIEFGDYKCPACKAWHEQIFPQIKEAYIDTEQANFAYINTPFHGEESQLAALAAESVWAQDEQDFWIFHDEVFKKQPQQNHDDSWVTPEVLLNMAKEHTPELDIDRLEDDLQKQVHLPQVEEDMRLVQEYNIEFTPSIMINDTLVEDPFDIEAIVSTIEKELEEQD